MYKKADAEENWASLVKRLLCNLGFFHVWLSQGVGNHVSFLNMCKQRLSDNYLQEWFGKVKHSSDTMLYRYVKLQFDYSEYLNILNLPLYRYTMTKFLATGVF